MNNFSKVAIVTTLLLSVSACVEGGLTQKDPADWDSAAAKQIDERISQSAERATDANETLSQIERTRTAPTETSITGEDLASLPPELQRPTTVEWTGPAVDLVSELSRNIGYTFAVVGQEPSIDIMVSVSAVDEPAVKVFEDVGYQVSQYAELFMDPNAKRVEFRYLSDHHAANNHVDAPSSPKTGMKSPSLKQNSPQGNAAPTVRKHKERLGK